MKRQLLSFLHRAYRLIRPVLFLFKSETIHDILTFGGSLLGKCSISRGIIRSLIRVNNPILAQELHGITFNNPIGLSAGFDYRALLPEILPSLGFGFGTVGTITNQPYEGNPKPRLGRLVKSRSLLVNKGFKNDGIDELIARRKNSKFDIPIGLSLGKTNSRTSCLSQNEAIADVQEAFQKAITARLPFSYYELNISCPNLYGSVSFYPPQELRKLCEAVGTENPDKPLFVKMPITESDADTRAMLAVLSEFPYIKGVIFGNLWKDRTSPVFNKEEIAKATKGNFSGAPTWQRSNQLISLAFKEYGKRFTIIGCGGVFSAQDAYTKIRLGASLVQMITGLIFEGPQLPAQINLDLIDLLKKDGFKNISEAVGVDNK